MYPIYARTRRGVAEPVAHMLWEPPRGQRRRPDGVERDGRSGEGPEYPAVRPHEDDRSGPRPADALVAGVAQPADGLRASASPVRQSCATFFVKAAKKTSQPASLR